MLGGKDNFSLKKSSNIKEFNVKSPIKNWNSPEKTEAEFSFNPLFKKKQEKAKKSEIMKYELNQLFSKSPKKFEPYILLIKQISIKNINFNWI